MPSTDALHYVGTHDSPAAHISLRAIDPDRFVIVNGAAGGEVLEEIEESKAFWEVYDGAVYMFQVRVFLSPSYHLTCNLGGFEPTMMFDAISPNILRVGSH